jgi:hypothetical protein
MTRFTLCAQIAEIEEPLAAKLVQEPAVQEPVTVEDVEVNDGDRLLVQGLALRAKQMMKAAVEKVCRLLATSVRHELILTLPRF